jgi:hypothetical protein
MWRTVVLLALVASCKKSDSCGQLNQKANTAIAAARAAPEMAAADPNRVKDARADVTRVAAAEKYLADVAAGLASHSCAPSPICCKDAAKWVDENAKAKDGDRPTFRFPTYSKEQTLEALAKDSTAYNHAIDNLHSELVKGKAAKLKAVTDACTEANDFMVKIQAAAPKVLAEAHAKADSALAALETAAVTRDQQAAMLTKWSDSLTLSGQKVDLGSAQKGESATFAAARTAVAEALACK